MATEMVEYRPGRWAKVVDGRIVGRATPEEVAAWQLAGGRTRSAGPNTPLQDLDIEVNLSAEATAGPARTLDVSLRPAFARRGRRPRPAEAPPSPPPTTKPPASRKPAAGRAKQPSDAPSAAEPSARHSKPPASDPGASASRKKQRASPAPSGKSRASADRGEHRAPPAAGDEATDEGSLAEAKRGPHYWWIWNAHGQPVASFLREWVPRYKAKFGREANTILCHHSDLDAVEASGYPAEASPLLQSGHFYLGHQDAN